MRFGKIITGFAALVVVVSSLSVAAGAVEPSYKVSDDYKDTLYYNNLLSIELTGDGATDVISVALSQLGYHEGNSDKDLDGLNGSGSRNFTEYNVLFGKLDNGEGNGTSYGYAWCAAFVNWCLRQARVDKDLTGGMYVSCHAWRTWFANQGATVGAQYHDRQDDYIPQKGDLIFYKSLNATHSRSSDHIGIVLKSEGGRVYVIEGNGDNRVALHEYDLTDRYIVGYGSIAYKTAEVPEVDYYEKENHLPGYFIAGKGLVTAYAGPASASGKVASLTPGAVYRITAVQGLFGRVALEDGGYGWVSLKRFTPITTDPYVTVEMVAGEQVLGTKVTKGATWIVPEFALAGETGDLLGWCAGESCELISVGQALTLQSDMRLEAVYPQPTTEAETEPPSTLPEMQTEAPTTEQTASETEPETALQTERVTEPETMLPDSEADAATEPSTEQTSGGCQGMIGTAAIGVMMAIGAVFALKKKD